MRILVVEDDESIRALMGELIESFGHTPFMAEDTEKASELLGMVKPDIILLDLLLKGQVSTPFIKLTRDVMKTKSPRIILVSAMQKAENVAQSNNTEFLRKPFGLEELHTLIEGKNVRQTDRSADRATNEMVCPPQ